MLFLIGFASFCRVFIHGFQSRNVAHGHYRSAFFTSLLMSVSEILFLTGIIVLKWDALIPISIGGAVGVTASIYVHKRIFHVIHGHK